MQTVSKNNLISIEELKKEASKLSGLVKAVVDVEKSIMVVGADLHSDEEEFLINDGSRQENLWGINIYPYEDKENWIEFDSMINLRPSWGNLSRGVDSKEVSERIKNIVYSLVSE